MTTNRKRIVPSMLLLLATSTGLAAEETKSAAARTQEEKVARGAFLVHVGGCNDCHTPWKMGANGPEPDMTRMLSGHPQDLAVPPAPALPPGFWSMAAGATMTAWSGPWGVSFTANLTPDKETGLGGWTEEEFLATLQTGRHQGRGRPILPPMPWQNLSTIPEAELSAIYAYLRTIPAVRNKVPDPIAPAH